MDYSKGEIFRSATVYQSKSLQSALTVHSFKEPDMLRRIHQYYLELSVRTAESHLLALRNKLAKAAQLTGRTNAFP